MENEQLTLTELLTLIEFCDRMINRHDNPDVDMFLRIKRALQNNTRLVAKLDEKNFENFAKIY